MGGGDVLFLTEVTDGMNRRVKIVSYFFLIKFIQVCIINQSGKQVKKAERMHVRKRGRLFAGRFNGWMHESVGMKYV